MGCYKSKPVQEAHPQIEIDRETMDTLNLMRNAWHSMNPDANQDQILAMHTSTFMLMVEGLEEDGGILYIDNEDNVVIDLDLDSYSDICFDDYFKFR